MKYHKGSGKGGVKKGEYMLMSEMYGENPGKMTKPAAKKRRGKSGKY